MKDNCARHHVHQLWYCEEYWPCVQHATLALEPLGSALHLFPLNYWSKHLFLIILLVSVYSIAFIACVL